MINCSFGDIRSPNIIENHSVRLKFHGLFSDVKRNDFYFSNGGQNTFTGSPRYPTVKRPLFKTRKKLPDTRYKTRCVTAVSSSVLVPNQPRQPSHSCENERADEKWKFDVFSIAFPINWMPRRVFENPTSSFLPAAKKVMVSIATRTQRRAFVETKKNASGEIFADSTRYGHRSKMENASGTKETVILRSN